MANTLELGGGSVTFLSDEETRSHARELSRKHEREVRTPQPPKSADPQWCEAIGRLAAAGDRFQAELRVLVRLAGVSGDPARHYDLPLLFTALFLGSDGVMGADEPHAYHNPGQYETMRAMWVERGWLAA